MNWEIVFPFCFVAFLLVGLLIGGFAGYRYLRFERDTDVPRLAVAILVLSVQYLLMLAAFAVRGYLLAPTILMFLAVLGLVLTIWLGLAAHTIGGRRIALSGLFTFLSYACGIVATVITR